jgi:hypothetical protein
MSAWINDQIFQFALRIGRTQYGAVLGLVIGVFIKKSFQEGE